MKKKFRYSMYETPRVPRVAAQWRVSRFDAYLVLAMATAVATLVFVASL